MRISNVSPFALVALVACGGAANPPAAPSAVTNATANASAADDGASEGGVKDVRPLLKAAAACPVQAPDSTDADAAFDFDSNCEALKAWTELSDESVAAKLFPLLASPDPKHRFLVADRLANVVDSIENPADARLLLTALANEKVERVQAPLANAASNIVASRTNTTAELVGMMSKHPTSTVRQALAERLVSKDPANDAIAAATRAATKDANEDVAVGALGAFQGSDRKERCAVWREALKSEWLVANYAGKQITRDDACTADFDAALSLFETHKSDFSNAWNSKDGPGGLCARKSATPAQKKRASTLLTAWFNGSKSDTSKVGMLGSIAECDLPAAKKLAEPLAKSKDDYARKAATGIIERSAKSATSTKPAATAKPVAKK